ncbi:MAG: hypothetical protein Q8P18_10865 [Pseudomonadota bacterium]|nr:hypothetical protein [Pseudomonadota bacterium]
MLLLLAACTAPTHDSGDTGTPANPPVNQVATRFEVADEDEAFDLDGDGAPDNAIADLAGAIDSLVAERLATNVHVVVVQLADVNRWAEDPAIQVGLFPAVDADSDGSDNASGAEVFDATGFLDAEGRALEPGSAAIEGGRYTTNVPTSTFQVGSFVFDVATGVYVTGTPTAGGQTGVAGIGVTTEALTHALTQEGVDEAIITLLTDRADLDLDRDGVVESVSMAFTFEATTCQLEIVGP